MGDNNSDQSGKVSSKRTRPCRWLRFGIVFILCLGLGVPAFYGFEKWRGDRAWQRYAEGVRASRGSLEPLKLTQVDEKTNSTDLKPELEQLTAPFDKANRLVKDHDSSIDLVAYAEALAWVKAGDTNQAFRPQLSNTNQEARTRAARAITEAVSANPLFFAKLRAALQEDAAYPFGYFSAEPPDVPVPYVFPAIEVARLLRVKSAADLALGNTARALDNVNLTILLSESLRRDPHLMASIGRTACRTIALRAAHRALAEHRFSAAELVDLQRIVASTNILRRHLESVLVDRNRMLAHIDYLHNAGRLWKEMPSTDLGFKIQFIPSGWTQHEKVHYAETCEKLVKLGIPGPAGMNSAALEKAAQELFTPAQGGKNAKAGWISLVRHTALAPVCTPHISVVAYAGAAAQVATDLAWLGAELEVHCLEKGAYPARLEAVLTEPGQVTPLDPFTNQPYRYRREPDGGYKLWSVGWNQKDDGGKPGPRPFEMAAPENRSEEDWVLSVGPRT